MRRTFATRGVLLVTAVLPFALVRAHMPPNASDEAQLLKAAGSAELHGVAVYRPAVSGAPREKDVKEWPKIVQKLRDEKDKSAARMREYVPKRVLEFAAKDGVTEALALTPHHAGEPQECHFVRSDFLTSFKKILDDRDFYDEQAFKGLDLDDEAKRLVALGKKRTAREVAILHWKVMKAIFPDSIPGVPLDFQTIRVQVRDEKETVLVLSCSEACRWEIVVKPGAKVTGVVLCGGYAQEIEFYDNPAKAVVVYRAAHDVNGVRRLNPGDEYYDGHELRARPDKKSEVRDKFEAGIKKLTGKGEFVSMQRENTPKSEPYIIPPKKK